MLRKIDCKPRSTPLGRVMLILGAVGLFVATFLALPAVAGATNFGGAYGHDISGNVQAGEGISLEQISHRIEPGGRGFAGLFPRRSPRARRSRTTTRRRMGRRTGKSPSTSPIGSTTGHFRLWATRIAARGASTSTSGSVISNGWAVPAPINRLIGVPCRADLTIPPTVELRTVITWPSIIWSRRSRSRL